MEKFIGQDIENLQEREQFIKDNADALRTRVTASHWQARRLTDSRSSSLNRIQEECPELLIIER